MSDREQDSLAGARARIEALERELARLRTGLRLTLHAETIAHPLTEQDPATISGLEEMVLLVNPDRTVGYLNAPMSRLLEVDDRKSVLGEPLETLDRRLPESSLLTALFESARQSEQSVAVERLMPDLPGERLPETPGARPTSAPVLRLVATPMKGRVQISVQDVTRLRWLENTFSRFVSPKVISQMLARPAEDILEMQRREISMLYVDLRGFTSLSQDLPLPTLQAMMHRYFERMQEAVERYDGTVGQFVGDEVVALFGAPVPSEDYALRALLTAVDMVRAHARTLEEWAEAGWPQPGIGVGISTGEVAVGNMGTPSHMYYTALGYPMNLGARLCAAAQPGEILTTPETHRRAREALRGLTGEMELPYLRFESRGVFRFKNVNEPVEVVQVLV